MAENLVTTPQKRSTIRGTLSGFLSEALVLPTGLITTVFLTRSLGPEGYGLFTLAVTVIVYIEWCTISSFSRTTIKFVSEAENWQPVGITVLQQHLLVSVGATFLLCVFAVPIAQLMDEPRLAHYLILFALEIPLFALARAHRNILIGLGCFLEQAIAGSSRWITRLIFIVLLVKLGFSLPGVILGSIASCLVELMLARFYVRPPLFSRSSFLARQLWSYAVPLTLFSFCLRLYDKLDLFMLQALGGTVELAGIYGAAQNLAILPGLFALSLTPVLLSNVSRALRDGNMDNARQISQQGIRLALFTLPFAAMISGTAPEIIHLIFGAPYALAAPLLAILIFGAILQVMISVNTAILIAAGKPNWTFGLIAPLLPLILLGHWWFIPHMGAIGATLVTTLAAGLGTLATAIAVYHFLRISFPYSTLWRVSLTSWVTYVLADFFPSPGFGLLLKLSAITLTIPLILFLLGEFNTKEISQIWSLFQLPIQQEGRKTK